jgi:four helix bundle protein
VTPRELEERANTFAKAIILLCRELPPDRGGRLLGDQLFKAATAIGANYRAACRGRSRAEFIARLGVVVEEADEAVYWLGILSELRIGPPDRLRTVSAEARQLLAIFAASLGTARRRRHTAPW